MISAVCLLQAWLMWNFIIFQVSLFLYCGTPLTPVSTRLRGKKTNLKHYLFFYFVIVSVEDPDPFYRIRGGFFFQIPDLLLCQLAQNKIISIFVRFIVRLRTVSPALFQIPGWKKIRIWDKHTVFGNCSCIFD